MQQVRTSFCKFNQLQATAALLTVLWLLFIKTRSSNIVWLWSELMQPLQMLSKTVADWACSLNQQKMETCMTTNWFRPQRLWASCFPLRTCRKLKPRPRYTLIKTTSSSPVIQAIDLQYRLWLLTSLITGDLKIHLKICIYKVIP